MRNLGLMLIASLLILAVRAESNVTVTIDASKPGVAIPSDFLGVSYETRMALAKNGVHYFRPDNAPLLAMFKQLGIKSLRVGGNTVDKPEVDVPGEADIDSLFAFARAADVKVIYALRLKGAADPTDAARIAKYIWSKYKDQLTCFAIGNEPNMYVKEPAEYCALMKKFIDAIDAPDVAKGAKFSGPGSTPGKVAWSRALADEIGPSGKLALITQHSYPGGRADRVAVPTTGRSAMLSDKWVEGYQKFYDSFVPATKKQHLGYRLEECNSFFNGGRDEVSNTFASALWALDFLYWWAEHDCAGVNFHTGDAVSMNETLSAPRYALFLTSEDGYRVNPIAYAFKAFDVGSHGTLVSAKLKSENEINLAAYAVRAGDALCVTLINKSPEDAPADASINVIAGAGYSKAQSMLLASAQGLAAKSGVTLGDSSIDAKGGFPGRWQDVVLTGPNLTVQLPAGTAMVVRLTH